MGYRSDIAIALYATKKEDVPLIKLWLKENFPHREWDDEANITWFHAGMIFNATHIKWYDSYDDIQRVEQACDEFVDMFCRDANGNRNSYGAFTKGCFEYVRVGEDYNDVETKYYGDYHSYLDVKRDIQINVPNEETK